MAIALGRHRFPMLATQPRIFHRSAAKRLAASGLWGQRPRIKRNSVRSSTPAPKDAIGHHENGLASIDPAAAAAAAQIVKHYDRSKRLEERIERAIFDCRFLTLFGVIGSLAGSLLCFVKGSLFVLRSFIEYFNAIWQGVDTEVILLLVEAVDIYLMGTVMLIFGMGLYELFVSTLDIPEENLPAGVPRTTVCGSNLFGLFRLQERPKWLEIRSLDELKTKLGHVIVMILLVGMFDKSKKIVIHTALDLVCLSASILFSSGCLFLLSKLHK
ncbi:uncharacterized protein LOC9660465 [Selaginella moellendorffii]|uniref:uncharacterized protein LOC9660465 n=1 Tax=Selaginella moellendorffii TaxID=88036 RepID=UPI000D1CC994|nr:uncharacterized protein LOC9660465 [Selaginella moellendorffii]|eukprot:XP_002964919.2 uncharacterized protein LOC9660465 [Selaginella moellendorffii]